MKHYKRKISLVLTAGFLFSCSSPSVNSNSSNISQEQKLEIVGQNTVGINEYITVTALFEGKECEVKWESSDKSILTISSAGIVKGIKEGKALIKATKDSNVVTKEITVHESMQLGRVFSRFDNSNYKLVVASNIADFDVAFTEYYYDDSYYYESNSSILIPNFGLGQDDKGCFEYYKQDGKVTSAVLLRDNLTSYRGLLNDLSDIGTNTFANTKISEDNKYDLKTDTFTNFFFVSYAQKCTQESSDKLSLLYSTLKTLELEVLTPYSFVVKMAFGPGQECSLNYEIIKEENDALKEYLTTHNVSYPKVYDSINKVYDLVKNHNYLRKLGTYKKEDDTKIDIGNCYYTENYIYFDFTDEYITELKATKEYFDYGYINISGSTNYEDGVYPFTYKENASGEKELVLEERITEKNNLGKEYTKYYEFYENITLVMDSVQSDLYTFQLFNTSSLGKEYEEYYSDADSSCSVGSKLFEDYVQGLDAQVNGLLISCYLDQDQEANSIINYGAIFNVMGTYAYNYSSYSYTGFNSVSVPLLEEFIANI